MLNFRGVGRQKRSTKRGSKTVRLEERIKEGIKERKISLKGGRKAETRRKTIKERIN